MGADFFATFSNWGTEVRFITPGVGIISTALNQGYGVRSGASMTCVLRYVITGFARAEAAALPEALAALGLTVVDTALDRAVLAQGDAAAVARVRSQYPHLRIAPERPLDLEGP